MMLRRKRVVRYDRGNQRDVDSKSEESEMDSTLALEDKIRRNSSPTIMGHRHRLIRIMEGDTRLPLDR